MNRKVWITIGIVLVLFMAVAIGLSYYQKMSADSVAVNGATATITSDRGSASLGDIVTYTVVVTTPQDVAKKVDKNEALNVLLRLADGSRDGKLVSFAIANPVPGQSNTVTVPVKIENQIDTKYEANTTKALKKTATPNTLTSLVYAGDSRVKVLSILGRGGRSSASGLKIIASHSITVGDRTTSTLMFTKIYRPTNTTDSLSSATLGTASDIATDGSSTINVKKANILQGQLEVKNKSTEVTKIDVPTNCLSPKLAIGKTNAILPNEQNCAKTTTAITLAGGETKVFPITLIIDDYAKYATVNYDNEKDRLAFNPKAIYWLNLAEVGQKKLVAGFGSQIMEPYLFNFVN